MLGKLEFKMFFFFPFDRDRGLSAWTICPLIESQATRNQGGQDYSQGFYTLVFI